MRRFIELSEGVTANFVMIRNIPDESIQRACCEAFNELARLQRGKPERLGGACFGNPNLFPNGTGLYTYTTEHVGDLTNRMAAAWATGDHGERDFGWEFVNEKVSRALRHLRNRYGFERDIREQVERNYKCTRDEHVEKGEGFDIPLKRWWADLEEAGLRYAAAHAALPVYNEAQWMARQAAIEVGNFEFAAYQTCMERLEAHLGSPDDWAGYASLVSVGPDGKPLPYTG